MASLLGDLVCRVLDWLWDDLSYLVLGLLSLMLELLSLALSLVFDIMLCLVKLLFIMSVVWLLLIILVLQFALQP